MEVEEERTPTTNILCNNHSLVEKEILVTKTKLYKTSSMVVEVAVEQDIPTLTVDQVDPLVVMVVTVVTTVAVAVVVQQIIHNQASHHMVVETVETLVKMVKMVLVVVVTQEVLVLQSMVGVTEQDNLETDTTKQILEVLKLIKKMQDLTQTPTYVVKNYDIETGEFDVYYNDGSQTIVTGMVLFTWT